MKNSTFQINLTSLNKDELILPSDLLIPLNGIVRLIDFLENIQEVKSSKGKTIDDTFERRISSINRSNVVYRKSSNVYIQRINKQSPFLVELLVNVSPVVINALNALIENNKENIESSLVEYFNSKGVFSNDSIKAQKNVKLLIKTVQYILTFVSITISNIQD